MAYLDDLRDELLNDPLGRGYAAQSDAWCANDLNTRYRDGPVDGQAFFDSIILDVHRTGTSGQPDDEWLTIYSRCHDVARSNVGDDVFGNGVLTEPDTRSAAITFMRIVDTDVRDTLRWNTREQRMSQLLNRLAVATIMSQEQADDLKAMSDDQLTRAEELEFGVIPTANDVSIARS